MQRDRHADGKSRKLCFQQPAVSLTGSTTEACKVEKFYRHRSVVAVPLPLRSWHELEMGSVVADSAGANAGIEIGLVSRQPLIYVLKRGPVGISSWTSFLSS